MALSRKFRLSNSSEIKRVFRRGRSLNSELFQIKFLPIEIDISKFAIIAGSKVSKKAAVRNKIKRRLSEIIRLNISKIKQGFLVVVVAKPKTADREFKHLREDLMNNLNRIG